MDDMIDDDSFYLLIDRKDDVTFEKFYDHFSKAIFGVVLKSVKDYCIAEDITQDTFVKAYFNFAQFDPAKGRLYPWLSTIARNSCIDYHRKKLSGGLHHHKQT